jgi:replicative DNA helicase
VTVTKNDPLVDEVYPAESYLTGLFWSNPELYSFYSDEKISSSTFANNVWSFFFRIGRELVNRKIANFDDISVGKIVEELGWRKHYDKYGGYDTMDELMGDVAFKKDNFDAYFEEVQKYNMLRNLRGMLGDKVITDNGKYQYKKMTADQVHKYWMDAINKLSFVNNKIEEDFLLEGIREEVKKWNESPDVGLEYYNSPALTKISTGWAYGHVYILGAFSGRGKTSFSMNKVFLSCIKHKEPLLVIANEQSKSEFLKLLLVTAMGVGTKGIINRQSLNEGNFTEEESIKIEAATRWIEELSQGETRLVTFVYLEEYTMQNVKNVIRHYAMRGVRRVLLDTMKPTTDGSGEIWTRFQSNFRELYELARPNGGGLDLAVYCNVQLTDTALGRRFLNEHAFANAKAIKNEASVVHLMRPVWQDEYAGGKNELDCYTYEKDEFNSESDGKTKWYKKHFKLKEENGPFVLIFTAKNRRGKSNETGLDVLVMRQDLNSNTWWEVGWCKVANDYEY